MIFSRPRAQHLNFSLLFVYLILPSTSTVIFDTFICRTFDSGRFLEAQMTLTCDETNYNRRWWMIYAFVCIAIYPVCVPAFCMMMLWKHREEINPPNVKSIKQALQKRRNLPQLGMIKFLFQMFTPRCYWFGIFLLWFVKAPESSLSLTRSPLVYARARARSPVLPQDSYSRDERPRVHAASDAARLCELRSADLRGRAPRELTVPHRRRQSHRSARCVGSLRMGGASFCLAHRTHTT